MTVRLHADTVRTILERQIDAAALLPAEKDGLLARVRKLPVQALKKITDKLLDLGADKMLENIDHLRELLPLAD